MGRIRHSIRLVVTLLTTTARLEEKILSDIGHNKDGDIECCLDVGFLGVDDPRTQTLT